MRQRQKRPRRTLIAAALGFLSIGAEEFKIVESIRDAGGTSRGKNRKTKRTTSRAQRHAKRKARRRANRIRRAAA